MVSFGFIRKLFVIGKLVGVLLVLRIRLVWVCLKLGLKVGLMMVSLFMLLCRIIVRKCGLWLGVVFVNCGVKD